MDTGNAELRLPPAIQQAAEAALSEQFGVPVRVTAARNFWPYRVFRCALQVPAGAAPDTVIVRLPRVSVARSETGRLDHERTALEFLAGIGSAPAPRFLAGGTDAGYLASEDLGDGPSLLDNLLGADAAAATQGVLAFARGLGRLHAQTAQGVSGKAIAADMPYAPVPVAEHWRSVREAVARLGLPAPPTEADQNIAEVTRLLAAPNTVLALSSGDPSVVNCKVSGNYARFFDFEEACFRSAFCDAAVLRFLYPTGGPPWRLPPEVTRRAEDAYRTELSRVYPEASCDARYEAGMAAACAAWMLVRLARLPRVDAGPDRDPWPLLPPGWSGPIPMRSRRQQLVSILETAIASAVRADRFAALTAWCVKVTETLRARWPEATEGLPRYPAFQRRPEAG